MGSSRIDNSEPEGVHGQLNKTLPTDQPIESTPVAEKPAMASFMSQMADADKTVAQAEDGTWHCAPCAYEESSTQAQIGSSTETVNGHVLQPSDKEAAEAQNLAADDLVYVEMIRAKVVDEETAVNNGAHRDTNSQAVKCSDFTSEAEALPCLRNEHTACMNVVNTNTMSEDETEDNILEEALLAEKRAATPVDDGAAIVPTLSSIEFAADRRTSGNTAYNPSLNEGTIQGSAIQESTTQESTTQDSTGLETSAEEDGEGAIHVNISGMVEAKQHHDESPATRHDAAEGKICGNASDEMQGIEIAIENELAGKRVEDHYIGGEDHQFEIPDDQRPVNLIKDDRRDDDPALAKENILKQVCEDALSCNAVADFGSPSTTQADLTSRIPEAQCEYKLHLLTQPFPPAGGQGRPALYMKEEMPMPNLDAKSPECIPGSTATTGNLSMFRSHGSANTGGEVTIRNISRKAQPANNGCSRQAMVPVQDSIASQRLPNYSQSRGRAPKDPREAVADAVHSYIKSRKGRREAAQKRAAGKKRKLDAACDTNTQKAHRETAHDDAARIAHSEHDTDEGGLAMGETDRHESMNEPLARNLELREAETTDVPEKLDVLDFEVKRALSSKSKSYVMKTIQKVFGEGNAEVTEGGSLMIKNMVSPLWEEQARAVYWMVLQEEIAIGLRGGILAADMGTGKTVMSLGVIAGNPPLPDDLRDCSKATLVVVPSQKVARQWKDKIAEHCDRAFTAKCLLSSPKDRRAPIYFEKLNIVVTTYHEICKQLPRASVLREIEKNWNNPTWRAKIERTSSTSAFFYTKWYRVILDEAHKISNKETGTFKSCRQLRAKYRWCLSGTPLSNTDEELYPYLTFLACDFAKSIGTFQNKFKGEQEAAMTGKSGARPHLDALMQMILYRYKISKDLVVGGKEDIRVPLSAEETLIFNEVKPIMSKKPSKLIRKKQVVSHFFNLERMFSNDFTIQELEGLLEDLATLDGRKSMLDVLFNDSKDHSALETYSTGFDVIQEIGCDTMTGDFSFEPFLREIHRDLSQQYRKCTHCNLRPQSWNWVQSKNCKHRYCTSCLGPTLNKAGQCSHPDCNEEVIFHSPLETLSKLSTIAAGMDSLGKGKDHHGTRLVKPSVENPAHLLSDLDRIPIPPSTKLVLAAAVILTWRREHPEDKIVVFIEFLTSAKVLGTMLQKAGERFLYMFGGIGDNKGQAVLDSFRGTSATTGAPILLAGLGCCSEAINLTEANRVITIDLWWNKTREQQAFARVHRIGQEKPTYLVRIVSDGDKRIEELQRKKLREINYALHEDGHSIKKLKAEEFNALFEEDSDPAEGEEFLEDGNSEFEDEIGDSSSDAVTVHQACGPMMGLMGDSNTLVDINDIAHLNANCDGMSSESIGDLALLRQAARGLGDEDDSAVKTEESEIQGFPIGDNGYGDQDAVMSG